MKRVALAGSLAASTWMSSGAETTRPRLHDVRGRILRLLEQQAECYSEIIRPRLAEHGIRLVDWSQLTPEEA